MTWLLEINGRITLHGNGPIDSEQVGKAVFVKENYITLGIHDFAGLLLLLFNEWYSISEINSGHGQGLFCRWQWRWWSWGWWFPTWWLCPLLMSMFCRAFPNTLLHYHEWFSISEINLTCIQQWDTGTGTLLQMAVEMMKLRVMVPNLVGKETVFLSICFIAYLSCLVHNTWVLDLIQIMRTLQKN